MNKVMIGPAAVSRYHQIRKFFPIENFPNLEAHDFPTAKDYKLLVTGYTKLTSVASGSNRGRRSFSEERSHWLALLGLDHKTGCMNPDMMLERKIEIQDTHRTSMGDNTSGES